MEQIAELRRQFAEAEAQAEEAKARAEEAKARAEKEREAGDALVAQIRPKYLIEHLESYHSLSLARKVVTDRSLTTQDITTDPFGLPFPRRIIPWVDFPAQQEKIWEKLLISERFNSQRVYPCTHQLEYVRKNLSPISSEMGLLFYTRDIVENPLRILIEEINKDEQLREQFQLRGAVQFEYHTNPEQMPVSGASWRSRVGSEGQFSTVEQPQMAPVIAVEYKTPYKFPSAYIIAGLSGEIRPDKEVINKKGDSFEFLSKSLVTAMVIQLFSFMIAKGVQYGFIFDGEAIIFLYIPDDPSTVYYHLSIPHLDVQEDDKNKLHKTSVAQILAFILGALAVEPPGQSWHDAAAGLETWTVKYIDILQKIPETGRREPSSSSSPYNSSRWKGFIRQGKATSGQQQRVIQSQNKSNTTEKDEVEAVSIIRIEDRLYCTQKCLLGLASGGALDAQCPNLRDHGKEHIQKSTFLRLICIQLAEDRGTSADCKPLYIKGSRGALFKIRLSLYGYTLVGKGVEKHNRDSLFQERKIYHQLRPIQGDTIPVYLGISDLKLPYYYDCGVYITMLFLSWAGRPLYHYLNPQNETRICEQATTALKTLHNLQVLHKDAKPRNILWDEHYNRLMFVDFERAEIRAILPVSNITPSQENMKAVMKEDAFGREIESAILSIRTMASGRRWLR